MNHKTSIDRSEVDKFAQLAQYWWDTEGPLKTLHDINPVRLQYIQKWASLPQQHVLDVGCGGGILSESLALYDAHVTGLDVDPNVIKVAQTHAEQSNLSIKYHCMPIESFKAVPFDAITCMEMLEHVADPSLVIHHCTRLLKPGGYLFLSTINRTVMAYGGAIVAAEYLLGLLPKQTHDYQKFIKPSELASILRKEGLRVKDVTGVRYNPILRQAELCDSLAINYLMVAQKS